MKHPLFCLLLLILIACSSQPVNRQADSPPTTVAAVDLARYVGLWYEIARFPNRFEVGCENVTAEYALNEDGTIKVTNSCYKDGDAAPADIAVGKAWIVDTTTNAKLKVQFAPAWVPFAAGDYWVLSLEPDYSAALVGSPDGKYLWILARTPQISPARLVALKEAAQAQGYNTSALELTKQSLRN